MLEPAVAKALLLMLALSVCLLGTAWLALAMDVHWQQVRDNGDPATPGVVRALRLLGCAALGVSLLICLRADHASMAALVWVMGLAGSALIVALTLSWRPRLLAPLLVPLLLPLTAWARLRRP